MAESMVERAARAIFVQMTEGVRWPEGAPAAAGWDGCSEAARGKWREIARAAIASLREPSDGMLHAARDWSIEKYGRGIGNDGATGCWQAMIDAALAEPDTLGE